ncbi:copper resistance protein CopC [Leucobacter sp. UT-8R-CII-1-4]|uniref:copper resistance CopC family protein n=1 Tax=unclassified Leucobacter TaxID=2621730 RepID=UPI0011221004|nr:MULTISPECIES: copper resistance protein CopC [unclassified Leucobacter]MDI6024075.1 copper resistance protein CopC [Leucobacter sp. UT-8R-CII-1-4]
MSHQTVAHRPVAVLLGVLSVIAWLIFASGVPAYAHDQVTNQTPAAGEHFDTSPDEVALTFTGEPLSVGAIIMVVDAEGESWEEGEPSFSGFTVTQQLKSPLPDGNYQVRWRIVSSDGHPISESFLFSVGDVSDALPIPEPASADSPVSAADNANQGEFSLDGASDDKTSGDSGHLRTALLAGAGALAALMLFALGRVVKTRSSRRSKGTTS